MPVHTFFHGTTHPALDEFRFGQRGYGEQIDPVNCIWLSSSFEQAKFFAVNVPGRKRCVPAYVYEVEVENQVVVADPCEPNALPVKTASLLVEEMLGLRRFFKRMAWTDCLASVLLQMDDEGAGDTAKKNEVFRVLSGAGVGLLKHPQVGATRQDGKPKLVVYNSQQSSGEAYALIRLERYKLGAPLKVS